MSEELIILPSAGALPGIPGEYAAGSYWVDRDARTIRPAQLVDPQPEPAQSTETPLQGDSQAGNDMAQEIAHLQEEVQQFEASQPQAQA